MTIKLSCVIADLIIRRLLMTIYLFMVCTVISQAQIIIVKSFRLLETDMTAKTASTMVRDQNGEICALIKVVSAEKGAFYFDTGILGVMKNIPKSNGWWVYVPHGVKRITIKHHDLGVLRNYIIPCPIEAARTYEMVLDTNATNLADSLPSEEQLFVDMPSTSSFGEARRIVTVGNVTFTMIRVDGGIFTMEAPPSVSDVNIEDLNLLDFTLSSYYIGETEVTQSLWEAVMGSTVRQKRDEMNSSYKFPIKGEGPNYPMYNISWDDCQEFVSKLNQNTGLNFRLPTEAEWEYAARGGNMSQDYRFSGSNNLSDVAWYAGNSNKSTHEVKAKQANELGIYDMSGNVKEWVQDSASWGDANNRVVRGGSWFDNWVSCRIIQRSASPPDQRFNDLGLRLVLQ